MTHEPECFYAGQPYVPNTQDDPCHICTAMRLAYRRGYNDHARSQQHWQDTHGAYRPNLAQMRGSGQVSSDDGTTTISFNQHGEGEN